ncbi:MAG: hypothetical protein GY950_25000 [bacterium]|nr:hypothetical protein [bacterium]
MGKPKVQNYNIKGQPLKCQVCGHDQFWFRTTLMNTKGASFFGFDWANKEAENYVCNHCGYVHWFIN